MGKHAQTLTSIQALTALSWEHKADEGDTLKMRNETKEIQINFCSWLALGNSSSLYVENRQEFMRYHHGNGTADALD